MKLFKLLIVSAAALSSEAKAEYNVFTDSSIVDEGLGGGFVAPRNRSDLIRDAALATSAAYNDTNLVAVKGSPLRHQVGFADRERLVGEGYEVTSFSAFVPGKGHVPAGIVAYKNGKVIVSFHGSESVEDFTQVNLRAGKVDAAVLGLTGSVHGGFSTRYLQSREALYDVLQDTLVRHGITAEDVKVVVTGHSLGGALATVAAADLKARFAPKARLDLVTFCSPRVFDSRAAANMEQLVGEERMIRMWREKDPVSMVSLGTRLFGWFTGYKHVGQSVKLNAVTEGVLPSLENHSFGSILAGAMSSKAETVHLDHVGVRSRIENVISNGIQKVGGFFRKVGSFCRFW